MSWWSALIAISNRARIWLPVVCYAGLIFCLSSIPGKEVPHFVSGRDHLLHFLEYLPFGFLIMRAFCKTEMRAVSKSLLFSAFVVSIYAFSDEFHQLFVPGRFFSYLDMLSDFIGSTAGTFLFLWRK